MQSRQKIAIIVAGGAGLRMGSDIPKQFLHLHGKPVIHHTLQAFLSAYDDMQVILVCPSAHQVIAQEIVAGLSKPSAVKVIQGGETRFHSVKNGLQEVTAPSVVFVHDGVRPLVSTELIQTCYEAAIAHGSAIPAIPMKDSIREVQGEHNKAVDRECYKIIQTPQTFLSEIILPAFDHPYDPLFTDEATVAEKNGHPVHLVAGEEANIKITKPLDLIIATALMQ
ncbi:2-C-methyl-D-erythritol 4-phosphate cytidylyltransferase [Chitinophaga skermanii]|uniref:2-C-methyl-D-erythritol 4-phosphate cytidylyltransferase n=1 Tax=Chitinophaga skermanii TaxID=331697 RepID=A0A327Q826_9BACT|nr:2-C-methyl-D-erythritol 4-phosphate cytidylyltransferase [Chitinophaga skermanii]RAI99861.1 2-C-methyl-D-erythritol 4-phosphate cytidylyltransferase [Chitinophaga skermanii]